MRLIALKPCSFGGEKFYIGDEVPSEYVLNPKTQVQMGVLSEVPDSGTDGGSAASCNTIVATDTAMQIVVQIDNDTVELEPTDDGIQQIFTVLVGKAAGAEAVIKEMDDVDSLRLLQLSTTLKTVKDLAEKRIQELNVGEQ